MAEFKRRLRRWFPTAQSLQETRGFGWLSHYLHEHPMLWVMHRRGVALGVALGIGIGVFPVPLQMPAAMLAAVAFKANVAAAAAATWLTNPFTMAGTWVLGMGDAVAFDPLSFFSATLSVNAVSEPASLGLVGLSLLGLGAVARRRKT